MSKLKTVQLTEKEIEMILFLAKQQAGLLQFATNVDQTVSRDSYKAPLGLLKSLISALEAA